jgi:hypothetical protein
VNEDELRNIESELAASTAELRRYVSWLAESLLEAQRKLAELQSQMCNNCRHKSKQDTCNCVEDLKLWAGADNFACSLWQP